MKKVKHNNREYFIENDRWSGYNKNGVIYRVINKDLITTLYNISNQEEDVLNLSQNDDGEMIELPSSGLGDTISKLTTALGIVPCEGCNKRKALLNKVFPWLKQKRDFTQQEIQFVKDIVSRTIMTGEESKELFKIYNEVTGSKVQQCACPGTIKVLIQRLNGFLT